MFKGILITLSTIFWITLHQNLFSEDMSDFLKEPNELDFIEKEMSFDINTDYINFPEIGDKNIFEAINDLSICRNEDVRKFINIYLTRGREHIKRYIERSYLYLDAVEEIFKENPDMPPELVLLPLLESGFNPFAVSRSKAVGLWQFMAPTARMLGLKNDQWVDERRNVRKSTRAAIRHLRGLHMKFGSWKLALAGYNGGGNYVARMLESSDTKDLWTLREAGVLYRETCEYVPRYIAIMVIYKNQKLFGIEDEITKPVLEEIKTVTVRRQTDLTVLSKRLKIPVSKIRSLNPELKQDKTPPVANYSLYLPSMAAISFNEYDVKLASMQKKLALFRLE